jgi:hypothetical protein
VKLEKFILTFSRYKNFIVKMAKVVSDYFQEKQKTEKLSRQKVYKFDFSVFTISKVVNFNSFIRFPFWSKWEVF